MVSIFRLWARVMNRSRCKTGRTCSTRWSRNRNTKSLWRLGIVGDGPEIRSLSSSPLERRVSEVKWTEGRRPDGFISLIETGTEWVSDWLDCYRDDGMAHSGHSLKLHFNRVTFGLSLSLSVYLSCYWAFESLVRLPELGWWSSMKERRTERERENPSISQPASYQRTVVFVSVVVGLQRDQKVDSPVDWRLLRDAIYEKGI